MIVSGSKDAEINIYNIDTEALQTVSHYSKQVNSIRYESLINDKVQYQSTSI